MSYEGQTSQALKYVQVIMGNTSVVYPNMTTSHRSFGGPYVQTRNTFNTTSIRVIADGGGTTTGGSWHLQRSLTNSDILPNRCMWYTNSTVSERWYPPLSKGLASARYTSIDSFNVSTSVTAVARIEWEI
jgi:hypothetical protein